MQSTGSALKSHSLTWRLAQVRAVHVRGMGAKAMLVLATLAAEPEVLHVLRALLQPHDYACLVHIAHRTVRTLITLQQPFAAAVPTVSTLDTHSAK